MSFAYATEPPTVGKVVIKTTLGDLEVELWPKEAPKAVRNFVQLSLEGYYDNTIFHRVVKDFIVQGGDPTGTGTGGESVYNGPFADELHSRLRFSHRGLLAMANTGRNSNKSQFFFTLDKTEELNGKNTIFGKIVGNTVFNLLKIGEVETGDDDRPLYPPKILRIEVLSPPFDDIEPRISREEREAQLREAANAAAKAKSAVKVPAKRNVNLLSFDDEEMSAAPLVKKRMQSSHDVLEDERLSKELAVKSGDLAKRAKEGEAKPRKSLPSSKPPASPDNKSDGPSKPLANNDKEGEKKPTTVNETKPRFTVQSEIERVQKEIRQMDASRRASKQESSKKAASSVDSFRAQYVGKATMGKRPKGSELGILEQLESFKSKISRAEPVALQKSAQICQLHGIEECKSCHRVDDELAKEDEQGWMAHSLKFKKTANVFEPTVDDYTYFGLCPARNHF
ncbi:cyclophilin-like domain-containing protein [Zopfochytrium polystomum]|nr:cyclophilin-like domain-containing protein [Zopfochytrium polystomum]